MRGEVFSTAFACLVVSACASDDDPSLDAVAEAVTLSPVTGFGSNPGNLKMYEYVPAGLPSGAPLVVVMHGCTESANVIATETEWNVLADRYRFAVAYPEQQSANNSSSCFNWFQTGDISRGQGEALSIKQMVDYMKTNFGSDPARVFVTGMSAGGYMTTVMMATYPDVFAGGAVNSGGAYACATSLTATTSCQMGSVSHTPAQWGDLVRNAFPGYTGPYPRLIAFHGSADFTVNSNNLQQSVDQWSNVLAIDETADMNETFRTATHKVYKNAAGRSMIETYLVTGMGHDLTVDPGTNVDQGGATGAFAEDHDVYSSYYAAVFFGLTGGGAGGGGGGGTAGGGGGTAGGGGGGGTTGGSAYHETFSSAPGPDNAGWALGGFTLDATRDATGTAGSKSITATAAPRFNTVTQTATWSGLAIGAGATLTYSRQLALSDANTVASAAFQVVVNDGADHVVDGKAISGFTSYSETAWTSHSVSLAAYAGKTVTLKIVVTATDPASIVSSAKAWVDDLRIQ